MIIFLQFCHLILDFPLCPFSVKHYFLSCITLNTNSHLAMNLWLHFGLVTPAQDCRLLIFFCKLYWRFLHRWQQVPPLLVKIWQWLENILSVLRKSVKSVTIIRLSSVLGYNTIDYRFFNESGAHCCFSHKVNEQTGFFCWSQWLYLLVYPVHLNNSFVLFYVFFN